KHQPRTPSSELFHFSARTEFVQLQDRDIVALAAEISAPLVVAQPLVDALAGRTDMGRESVLGYFDDTCAVRAAVAGPAPALTLHQRYERPREAGRDIQEC